MLSACSWSPPVDTAAPAVAVPATAHRGVEIVSLAEQMVGVRYRYGGSNPSGFDCSGLVQYTHAASGIDIPRTAASQYQAARRLALSQLQPGDLLFYNTDGKRVSHVAIYMGDGRFVHAPGHGRGVSIENVSDPYYTHHFVGAGRLWR